MTNLTRRAALTLLAGAPLAACARSGGTSGDRAAQIDARVDKTLTALFDQYPEATRLRDNAVGMLVIPLVTEVGFWLGGAYGRGALRIGGTSVDYYSTTKATAGLQIGAQQYAHVLFFMTEDALRDFRRSSGWGLGVNADYATLDGGGSLAAETLTSLAPVVAIVFGQAGIRLGATLNGVKYTQIAP